MTRLLRAIGGYRLKQELLHAVVIRTAAALGWNPRNDLVGVLNVTSFAVYAVRRVQADAFAMRRGCVVDHLVNICRAKILAWTAELFDATLIANIGVVNDQVRGLVFLMTRSRMI